MKKPKFPDGVSRCACWKKSQRAVKKRSAPTTGYLPGARRGALGPKQRGEERSAKTTTAEMAMEAESVYMRAPEPSRLCGTAIAVRGSRRASIDDPYDRAAPSRSLILTCDAHSTGPAMIPPKSTLERARKPLYHPSIQTLRGSSWPELVKEIGSPFWLGTTSPTRG